MQKQREASGAINPFSVRRRDVRRLMKKKKNMGWCCVLQPLLYTQRKRSTLTRFQRRFDCATSQQMHIHRCLGAAEMDLWAANYRFLQGCATEKKKIWNRSVAAQEWFVLAQRSDSYVCNMCVLFFFGLTLYNTNLHIRCIQETTPLTTRKKKCVNSLSIEKQEEKRKSYISTTRQVFRKEMENSYRKKKESKKRGNIKTHKKQFVKTTPLKRGGAENEVFKKKEYAATMQKDACQHLLVSWLISSIDFVSYVGCCTSIDFFFLSAWRDKLTRKVWRPMQNGEMARTSQPSPIHTGDREYKEATLGVDGKTKVRVPFFLLRHRYFFFVCDLLWFRKDATSFGEREYIRNSLQRFFEKKKAS